MPPLTTLIILTVLLFILFLLSSIFSGCETAYTSISPAKVHEIIRKKEKGYKIIRRHMKMYNQTLSTILIGNNIVNVSSSVLTTYLLSFLISDSGLVAIVSTAAVTPIIVIFGEILPKLLAKNYPLMYIKTFGWFIEAFYWFFFIITYPLSKLGRTVYITNSEKEIKTMLDLAKKEGVLEANESILAQKALDLDSAKISQHYIKLKDVVTIDANASLKDAQLIFKDSNYSRLPVVKNNDLIGILMLKDIFFLSKGRVVNYVKTVPLISANSTLSIALEKLRSSRSQMGFIVENNNSTEIKGIITMEDIIEELVGEIYDEFDEEEGIHEISLRKARVKSSTLMKDIFGQLELDENLLKDSEKNLTLKDWMIVNFKITKLFKNTKHTYKKIATFKVIDPISVKDQTVEIIIN